MSHEGPEDWFTWVPASKAALLVASGMAKLEHHPGEAFMRVFIETCVATELKGFNSIDLANIINGKSVM